MQSTWWGHSLCRNNVSMDYPDDMWCLTEVNSGRINEGLFFVRGGRGLAWNFSLVVRF